MRKGGKRRKGKIAKEIKCEVLEEVNIR